VQPPLEGLGNQKEKPHDPQEYLGIKGKTDIHVNFLIIFNKYT
jgi:hypothetical protein